MTVRVAPRRRTALEGAAEGRAAVRVGVMTSEWFQDGRPHPDVEAMGWLLEWGLICLEPRDLTGLQDVRVTDRGWESLAAVRPRQDRELQPA